MKKNDGIQNFDHGNSGKIHTNRRVWSNSMYNIPRAPNKEVVYKVSPNSEGLHVKLRPEKNHLSSMMCLDIYFTNHS